MSRTLMRHPKIHRIFRIFSDPLLIAGILAAIVRVRLRYIAAVRAGLIRMPADPLADFYAAERRAEEVTRQQPPPQHDAAPAAAAGAGADAGGYVPPYAAAAPAVNDNVTQIRAGHVPHVEPDLAAAVNQLFEAG